MLATGELASNLKVSILRVAGGFFLGTAVGFLLGTAMGFWRGADHYLTPVFNLLRQVPTVAWLPFLIYLLGIDELFKVVFIALGTVIPVTLKTYEGIKSVPGTYLEVVRLFEYGWYRVLKTVVVPSALPAIFTGLRLGLSEAWMLVIGAELVAASVGIGNVMTVARRLFQTDVVVVGVVTIALTGLLMDVALVAAERLVLGERRLAR
jgi:sulfonate transport system permease protein